MAVIFKYEVQRMDGSGYKAFKNQTKAESYGLTLKVNPNDKIQITRTAKGYAPFVYYI